jgi:hypothetical protein
MEAIKEGSLQSASWLEVENLTVWGVDQHLLEAGKRFLWECLCALPYVKQL